MLTHPTNINTSQIGSIASRLIAQEPGGEVMGATSRGVYLGLATGWVLFLTSDDYRGPLNINVQAIDGGLERLVINTPAQVSSERIHFPSVNLIISTSAATTWETSLPGQEVSPPFQRKTALEKIGRELLSKGTSSDIGVLLPVLAGFDGASSGHANRVYPLLKRLRNALAGHQVRDVAEAIEPLLGLGQGLTPSGDDLTLGLLFTLNRWGRALAHRLDVEALNGEITRRAYQKTTRLSANLIECACLGQVNEPLLLALDGMMTGEPEIEVCTALLAGWGNTSGLDALVGMALAMG